MKKTILALALSCITTAIGVAQSIPSDGKLDPVVDSAGHVDREAYLKAAAAWGPLSQNSRLGPSFDELNPNAVEDRPTAFQPTSKACALSFANRCNPYELGRDGCTMDNDYWSDSGQVAYVPTDLAKDPGLDRIQTFAYYNHVFALSPRLDYASGNPHPDPQTREENYRQLLGHAPAYPIAMERNYGMLQNEEIVIYHGGLLAVAGTQTSRDGSERPYPGFVFPKNKIPTAVAVTTENEFALVTIWDTETLKGQLAVVAIEAKYIKFHTWPYMALPNQGSFSDFKLLGYIDLPMAAPTSVAAASNGWWGGPSQTAGRTLGQLDLKDGGTRYGLSQGEIEWQGVIATGGYALVASHDENKFVVLDLSPLFKYVRASYLSSEQAYLATIGTRGPGPNQWPATFKEKPEIAPKVILEKKISKPTATLAGMRTDRWSQDVYKGYVASEDGTIYILDTSSLMNRWSYQHGGGLNVMGSFKVGRNPVSMIFTRFGVDPRPILPNGKSIDPLNNLMYVACRGDREVVGVVTWGSTGGVFAVFKDTRLDDPVAMSVATRGNILTVADFNGKKIISFRLGPIGDRYGVQYPAGADGRAAYDVGGEMAVQGNPFLVNSANVN